MAKTSCQASTDKVISWNWSTSNNRLCCCNHFKTTTDNTFLRTGVPYWTINLSSSLLSFF